MATKLAHHLHFLSLLLLVSMTTGCASISQDFTGLLTGFVGAKVDELPEQLPANIPQATIVMQADGESQVSAQYPLHQDAFIQEVVEKTGLHDRFRRMDIELFRGTPSGTHRLEIKYDRAAHRVDPMYDYALRPGDRLVVTEDTSTTLDDMLESLALPFAK